MRLWRGRKATVTPDLARTPAYPEYLYVEFPDGTTRRCKTTPCPTWGFPTTPHFGSPEWEIVNEKEEVS